MERQDVHERPPRKRPRLGSSSHGSGVAYRRGHYAVRYFRLSLSDKSYRKKREKKEER